MTLKKAGSRRKNPWTEEETDALIDAVEEHGGFGMGRIPWADIKRLAGDALVDRTDVQCKDRWRIIQKRQEAQEQGGGGTPTTKKKIGGRPKAVAAADPPASEQKPEKQVRSLARSEATSKATSFERIICARTSVSLVTLI